MSADSQPIELERSESFRRWLAIGLFIGLPWCLGSALFILRPTPVSEPVLKTELMDKRGMVDTIIVGDSRVLRIGGPPFNQRGWTYFNMGMSGVSPEDLAMAIRKAMLDKQIARVVIGLAFNNMTQSFPFELSRYYKDPSFRDPRILEFVGKPNIPRPFLGSVVQRIHAELFQLLPVGGAGETVRYLRAKWSGRTPESFFRADGTVNYTRIEEQIAAGTYDFAAETDPRSYFSRWDSEVRYLANKRLAPESKQLLCRVIEDLRVKRIPCLMYETGRIVAYQRMIDQDPLLKTLQSEWRAFFRDESYGCIKFLDADTLRPVYAERDFFDPVHFVGPTEDRLSERLADELDQLERSCRQTEAREPVETRQAR
jgi:hypothetical protein